MIYLSHATSLLGAVALLWIAARLMGSLFETLRLPRVIGEIVGGLVLGPTLLSHFLPGVLGLVFAPTGLTSTVLPIISQIGLVLLMFVSGTHLRSFVHAGERRVVAVLAVAGIAVPFALGLTVQNWFDASSLQGAAQSDAAFVLVFATAIAIASIPVISRIMMDLGIMETPFARIVISTAVIDDLVLYIVLAIALSIARSPGTPEYGLPALIGLDSGGSLAPVYHVAATIGLILLTLIAAPRLLRRAAVTTSRWAAWDNGFLPQIVLLASVTALSYFLNINPIFGALVAGMAVGRNAAQANLQPSRALLFVGPKFFVPIYFALVGFKLDLIRQFDPVLFAGFLFFACLVKVASIYAGAMIASQPRAIALNLAAALNARGGPGIVLASVAYGTQIINENFYAVLVLNAIVTSLLAGAWLGWQLRRGEGAGFGVGLHDVGRLERSHSMAVR